MPKYTQDRMWADLTALREKLPALPSAEEFEAAPTILSVNSASTEGIVLVRLALHDGRMFDAVMSPVVAAALADMLRRGVEINGIDPDG